MCGQCAQLHLSVWLSLLTFFSRYVCGPCAQLHLSVWLSLLRSSEPSFLGTCVDGVHSYTCQCGPLFTGVNCEQPVSADPCEQSPCQNGAYCCSQGKQGCMPDIPEGQYQCFCLDGFTGAAASLFYYIKSLVFSMCASGTLNTLSFAWKFSRIKFHSLVHACMYI